MRLDEIPEPSEACLRAVFHSSSFNCGKTRVIAHLLRQGKVLARIVTDIGPRLTSEEDAAIKTFEEIE